MKRTAEMLSDLAHYEAIHALPPLAAPLGAKREITRLIQCPKYDQAHNQNARLIEQAEQKVRQYEGRLRETERRIVELEKELEYWQHQADRYDDWLDRNPTKREDPASLDRYREAEAKRDEANERVRRVRRHLIEARDRLRDLRELRNIAVEEVENRRSEAEEKELDQLESDVVSYLRKSLDLADSLMESRTAADRLAALEILFLALKFARVSVEHLDAFKHHKDAEDQVDRGRQLVAQWCRTPGAAEMLIALFQRNINVIEANTALLSEIHQLAEKVDGAELDRVARAFRQLASTSVETNYGYRGIVDPDQLADVMAQMDANIALAETVIRQITDLAESSRAITDAATAAHHKVVRIVTQMHHNAAQIGEDLLTQGHFAIALMDRAVAEELLTQEAMGAQAELRQGVSCGLGKEHLEVLMASEKDRFLLEAAGTASDDLLVTKYWNDRVPTIVSELEEKIKKIRKQLAEAGEVPRQNARQFRAAAGWLYPASCIPVLGLIPAICVARMIEAYAPAFRSANPVYRDLGAEIHAKNQGYARFNTYVIINIIAGLILSRAGERLKGYLEAAGH